MTILFTGLRIAGAQALVILAGWDIIKYFDDDESQPELVATVRGGHIVTTADGRYAVLWAAIRFSFGGDEDDQSRCAVLSRACGAHRCDRGDDFAFCSQNAGCCCARR